jgi:hypothetical protein
VTFLITLSSQRVTNTKCNVMTDWRKETAAELEKTLTINIHPVEVDIHRSDEEYLSGKIRMSNGDTIEFHTYFKVSPNPQPSDESVNILINGEVLSVGPEDLVENETTIEFINRIYRKYKSIKA